MSFGRNPHVPKAQAAEQKAQQANDDAARSLAWREAARLWDRAAERETDGKRKAEYARHAETARENADAPAESTSAESADAPHSTPPASNVPGGGLLN